MTMDSAASPPSDQPPLRIGITIGLHHEAETLWNNGIKQNAVFLAEALKHCPKVASVVLVNTTATPVTKRPIARRMPDGSAAPNAGSAMSLAYFE